MPEKAKIFSGFADVKGPNVPVVPKEIEREAPICFAHNKANGKTNVGSFSVYEKHGKFFAESCFHVFSSRRDLELVHQNPKARLRDTEVVIVVGKRQFTGKLIEYQFNETADYACCSVTREVYSAFRSLLDIRTLRPNDINSITGFGAFSKKRISFFKEMQETPCRVNYGYFRKEMTLLKIKPKEVNIAQGDSGAIVYFKSGRYPKMQRAMIVCKTEDAAYIFRLT